MSSDGSLNNKTQGIGCDVEEASGLCLRSLHEWAHRCSSRVQGAHLRSSEMEGSEGRTGKSERWRGMEPELTTDDLFSLLL